MQPILNEMWTTAPTLRGLVGKLNFPWSCTDTCSPSAKKDAGDSGDSVSSRIIRRIAQWKKDRETMERERPQIKPITGTTKNGNLVWDRLGYMTDEIERRRKTARDTYDRAASGVTSAWTGFTAPYYTGKRWIGTGLSCAKSVYDFVSNAISTAVGVVQSGYNSVASAHSAITNFFDTEWTQPSQRQPSVSRTPEDHAGPQNMDGSQSFTAAAVDPKGEDPMTALSAVRSQTEISVFNGTTNASSTNFDAEETWLPTPLLAGSTNTLATHPEKLAPSISRAAGVDVAIQTMDNRDATGSTSDLGEPTIEGSTEEQMPYVSGGWI